MEEYRVEPVTYSALEIIKGWMIAVGDEEASVDHNARMLIQDLERNGYVVALVEPQGN